MSDKKINFQTDKESSDRTLVTLTLSLENLQPRDLRSGAKNNHSSFNKILSDRELVNEMFTPDYFMLVE